MRSEKVTIAGVLSQAGYSTAFHGKWHLDAIEESYSPSQNIDEAVFTGYNQIRSLNGRIAQGANASPIWTPLWVIQRQPGAPFA